MSTSLTVERRQAQIAEEAALDGIYAMCALVPAAELDAPDAVSAHKNLSRIIPRCLSSLDGHRIIDVPYQP